MLLTVWVTEHRHRLSREVVFGYLQMHMFFNMFNMYLKASWMWSWATGSRLALLEPGG